MAARDADTKKTQKGPVSGFVKVLIQQCLSARLQVKPPTVTDFNDAEYVEIGCGEVIYVCFLDGAVEEDAARAAVNAAKARLCEVPRVSKKVSVLDAHGDVLIVPQATLGGQLKGRAFQYHRNISAELGRSLYDRFVAVIEQEVASSTTPDQPAGNVKAGTYGNRQVLSMVTNGPSTHIIEG